MFGDRKQKRERESSNRDIHTASKNDWVTEIRKTTATSRVTSVLRSPCSLAGYYVPLTSPLRICNRVFHLWFWLLGFCPFTHGPSAKIKATVRVRAGRMINTAKVLLLLLFHAWAKTDSCQTEIHQGRAEPRQVSVVLMLPPTLTENNQWAPIYNRESPVSSCW